MEWVLVLLPVSSMSYGEGLNSWELLVGHHIENMVAQICLPRLKEDSSEVLCILWLVLPLKPKWAPYFFSRDEETKPQWSELLKAAQQERLAVSTVQPFCHASPQQPRHQDCTLHYRCRQKLWRRLEVQLGSDLHKQKLKLRLTESPISSVFFYGCKVFASAFNDWTPQNMLGVHWARKKDIKITIISMYSPISTHWVWGTAQVLSPSSSPDNLEIIRWLSTSCNTRRKGGWCVHLWARVGLMEYTLLFLDHQSSNKVLATGQ